MPRLSRIGLYSGLVIWLVIALVPPVMLIAAALNRTSIFQSPFDLLMLRDFTLDNFAVAIQQGQFLFFLKNSIIISVSAVIATLVVCVPLAYGLTKLGGRLAETIAFLVLALRFMPYVVLALPMFLVFLTMGLSGSRTGLLMAHLAIHIPFATWLMIGFFETVPKEVEEAAVVDGCGPWRLFWTINVPMVMPGINALAILVFIISWNEYLFALFLGGANSQPLTVGITRFAGGVEQGAQYGVIAAYGALIVLPVFLFALVANRYIVSGMTAGAVKG